MCGDLMYNSKEYKKLKRSLEESRGDSDFMTFMCSRMEDVKMGKRRVAARDSGIAYLVNLEDVCFCKSTKSHVDKPIVSYSFSSRSLRFNALMTKTLQMRKWEYVLVGYDPITDIIVLKQTGFDEYGARKVQIPSMNPKADPVKGANIRAIGIGPVVYR